MRDLETLQKGAANPNTSEKECNKYRNALRLMSSHYVDNAFFSVDFGSNHLGVTTATAPDMMHIAESGIFKYLLNVFIDSMPNATKAKVDALVEKLFVPIRSTKKSDFPRMNFKGGATSLTMLVRFVKVIVVVGIISGDNKSTCLDSERLVIYRH
jgi:hypothetical protein